MDVVPEAVELERSDSSNIGSASASQRSSTREASSSGAVSFGSLAVDVLSGMSARPRTYREREASRGSHGNVVAAAASSDSEWAVQESPHGDNGSLGPGLGGTTTADTEGGERVLVESVDSTDGWGEDGLEDEDDVGVTPAAGSGLVSAGLPFELVSWGAEENSAHGGVVESLSGTQRRRLLPSYDSAPMVPAVMVSSDPDGRRQARATEWDESTAGHRTTTNESGSASPSGGQSKDGTGSYGGGGPSIANIMSAHSGGAQGPADDGNNGSGSGSKRVSRAASSSGIWHSK